MAGTAVPNTAATRGPLPGRMAQIIGLLVLGGVGAELLSAYGETTGDPAGVAFSVVFFAGLYGAPALLAREVARRFDGGWPSLLLLLLGLGVAQACLIDQSLFSTSYQDYRGWEETREATLVPALGISLFNTYNFILGHVIFSFGAPVALAEAWRPTHQHRSWLGPIGIGVALVGYLSTAYLVWSDPESRSASPPQLMVSAVAILGCLAAAWLLGRRHRHRVGRSDARASSRTAPRVPVVLTAALVLAVVAALADETWLGLGVGLGATLLTLLGVWWASAATGWTPRHVAAVALPFLLVRGALAFSYFPLAGSVDPAAKYLHNVVMVVVVLLAGWCALRRHLTRAAARRT